MMPRLLLLIALMLALPAAAQAKEGERPVTILISIDGFRPDYLERGITPNLNALKDQGTGGAMRPSFPTKTFPNHFTLVTGLRPDHHGIVANSMIDPTRPGEMFSLGNARQALDPFWWSDAEPIWVTAEKQGLRTATMFWPGSEVEIAGQRPQDWLRYDENVTNVQRVATVLDWMRRPAAIRPGLVTLYFDTVDTAGHELDPASEAVNPAIAEVDARIGDLVAGLAELDRAANIIIVSDHGMASVSPDRVIQLDNLIDRASYIAVEAGPYAAIEPVTGTDNRVAEALLKPHDHMDCRRKEDLPARLEYGAHRRVAAIICLAQTGWSVLAGPPRYPVTGGAHGWDHQDPAMQALFIAAGPSIKPGAPLPLFDNVHVYPLLARLTGVAALPSDGDAAVLEPLLIP